MNKNSGVGRSAQCNSAQLGQGLGDDGNGVALVLDVPRVQEAQPVIRNHALLEASEVDVSEMLGYSGEVTELVDEVSCGLRSLGNTCYLNALLHALARIPSVMHWCCRHQESFSRDASHMQSCPLCNLAHDLRCITVHDAGVVAPITARCRGAWSAGRFDNMSQQDAHDTLCIYG